MSLTDEQISEHIKNMGDDCPYCGGKELKHNFMGSTWEGEDQLVECLSCGRKWKDIYILELEAIEELDDEEDSDEECEVRHQGELQETS